MTVLFVLLRDLGFGVCPCYRAVFRRCYLLLDGDSLQGAQDGDRFNRLSHLVYFDIFDNFAEVSAAAPSPYDPKKTPGTYLALRGTSLLPVPKMHQRFERDGVSKATLQRYRTP